MTAGIARVLPLPAVEGPPVVEMEDLSFSYGQHIVLDGASLTVRKHDFVSIVGPNGGGKTTLLKLMLGLIRPSRGFVKVFGVRPEEARRLIGYMPQQAHLDPQFPVTVMDVVLMGRLGHSRGFGPYTRTDKESAESALREMGMWEHRKTGFSALSGGQRQRALIARALACEPNVLLLDEPTAGLDLMVEAELFELLSRFARRLTVVVVSHDIGFVSQFVNKVVCVKRRVVVHPTSELTGELVSEIYGTAVKMVRHDRINGGTVHKCLNS